MAKAAITIERVIDLISAYGAEPGGWPEDEREAAEALLREESDQFAAALAEAHALDRLLDLEALPETSSNLAQRILADAPTTASVRGTRLNWLQRLLPGHIRLPAGAALASLGVGLVAGYSYANDIGFDAYLEADDGNYTLAVEDSFEGWLGTGEQTR